MAPDHATRLRHDEERRTTFIFGVTVCADRLELLKHAVSVVLPSRSKIAKSGKTPFCARRQNISHRCLRTTVKCQQILALKEMLDLQDQIAFEPDQSSRCLVDRPPERGKLTARLVCVSRAAGQRDTIVLDGRSFGLSLVRPNSRHGQRGHIPPVRSLVDSGSDGL